MLPPPSLQIDKFMKKTMKTVFTFSSRLAILILLYTYILYFLFTISILFQRLFRNGSSDRDVSCILRIINTINSLHLLIAFSVK